MKEIQDKEITEDKKDLTVTVKKYIVPCVLLVILAVIVSWITFIRVKTQIAVGPGWDTFAFLANALEFAGKGIGYSEPNRPPFLSFLTSLFFRLGYVDESTIFMVDGGLFALGAVGLYLLFKLRFDSIQSFLGALLFASFPIVLQWVGTGYTDVASVSLSIWAIYLIILSVKKDSRFFFLAFPMTTLAFLTRFPAGLILIPIILYLLITQKYLKNFKDMLIGITFSFLLLVPVFYNFYLKYADPFYPFLNAFSITAGSSAPTESIAYVSNPLYYIQSFNLYIMTNTLGKWIFHIFILIFVIGLLIYLYNILNHLRIKSRVKETVYTSLNITKQNSFLKLFLLFLIVLIFILTFNRVSYIISEALIVILVVILYYFTRNIKWISMDLLFFSWFMTFFTFHSVFDVKVDRYFITMMPPLIYFFILALSKIMEKLKVCFKGVNITSLIICSVIIVLLLFSTVSNLNLMNQGSIISGNPKTTEFSLFTNEINSNASEVTSWLIKNDLNYKNKTIYSDLWPYFSWSLGINVKPMPIFKDKRAINHELEKYDVDYYLASGKQYNLSNYKEIKHFGSLFIYKKIESSLNKNKSLLIGKNWQNYLEDVLDFKTFLIYDRNALQKPIYIDNYSLDELKKYKTIFLYNFAWHDREKSEKILLEYVNSGGTLVIDASSNLEGVTYNLDNSVFLNTLITRNSLPEYPVVWINPKLLNDSISFSPFVSDGQVWYGANYEPYGNNSIENLVTVNGHTLIGVQKVGNGKIIWIGYNFVWHAFILENTKEKQLIQDIVFGRNL